jgi:hypothetical protein
VSHSIFIPLASKLFPQQGGNSVLCKVHSPRRLAQQSALPLLWEVGFSLHSCCHCLFLATPTCRVHSLLHPHSPDLVEHFILPPLTVNYTHCLCHSVLFRGLQSAYELPLGGHVVCSAHLLGLQIWIQASGEKWKMLTGTESRPGWLSTG